jgi:hypothetical protein
MPAPTSNPHTQSSAFTVNKEEVNLEDLQLTLVTLLSQIIDSTNTIEIAKKTLESNAQFDVYALFLHLD